MTEMNQFWRGVFEELEKSGATNIVGTSHVMPMQAKLRSVAPTISPTIVSKGTQATKSPITPPKR